MRTEQRALCIERELAQVKKLIEQQLALSAKTEVVSRLLEIFHCRCGKMLRPGLVLLSGSACGKISDEHILVAAVLELIHNATLLHDDVVDNGQKRRGKPTLNVLCGNESAVLLGDFLLSRVFSMCVDLRPDVIKVIADTTARVCEGELNQIAHRRNQQLSESEYIGIITEKSASLFSCCCYLGAILSSAEEKQARLLAQFGLNIGIAFQIMDDLLDIIGDEDKTGKTLGTDADRNKPTLAVIHLLNAVEESEKSLVSDSLTKPVRNKKLLRQLFNQYHSIEYAQSRAVEFSDKAVSQLAGLSDSPGKTALIELADFIVTGTAQKS